MKKHSMILALILALTMAFVFIGCGGNLGQVDATGAMNQVKEGDDVGGDIIFQLSDILAELGEGPVSADDLDGTVLLALAGEPNVMITTDGGAFVIQFTTTQQWGEGLDVNYDEDGAEGIDFQEGDIIVATGKAIDWTHNDPATWDGTGGIIMLKVPGAADNPVASTTETAAGTPFELKYTITAGVAAQIPESDPPCIRVGARGANVKFQINDIIVYRP